MKILEIPRGTYRQFGNPFQKKEYRCYDADCLERLIKENNGRNPCFISVCCYQDDVPILMFAPFDFDSESTIATYDDAVALTDFCESSEWNYIWTYTGNRGYHVWIYVVQKQYEKRTLKRFQSFLADNLFLKTTDRQLFGDVRRLLRIPNTIHEKTNDECIVCGGFERGHDVDLDEFVSGLPKQKKEKQHIKTGNCNKIISEFLRERPCLLIEISKSEPSQWGRFATTAYLHSRGLNDDDIFKLFERMEWIDWNVEKTKYQINHIVNDVGYASPSCETIEGHGLCLGINCKQYRIVDLKKC